jgi:mRNA-degrading endonuclease RelE of RelBE toxin-antitoxin system
VICQVHIFSEPRKTLKKLDKTLAGRIVKRLEELAQDPFDHRISRQMETDPDSRYSRVGDWRIIYQADDATQTVNIVAIRPRSRAYR